MRWRDAGRRVGVVLDARDAECIAARFLGIAEIDDVGSAVPDAIEGPGARSVHGRARRSVDARIRRGAVLVDAPVCSLDREIGGPIVRAGNCANARERFDFRPVLRIRSCVDDVVDDHEALTVEAEAIVCHPKRWGSHSVLRYRAGAASDLGKAADRPADAEQAAFGSVAVLEREHRRHAVRARR